MYNRDYGLWFIPLFALLAFYFPTTSNNPPGPTLTSSVPVTQSSDDSASRAQGALSTAERLIRAYSGRNSRSENMVFPGTMIDFVIATVPDPLDTGLSHLFDRYVGAIQRAAEAAGYVPDRFAMPWSRSEASKDESETREMAVTLRTTPSAIAGTVSSGKKSETDELKKLPQHQREPGVILFRDRAQFDKLLVVFLVGESPTAGIHKASFNNALIQADAICIDYERRKVIPEKGQECEKQLGVLAPSFSGSAASLVNAFRTSRVAPKVRVVSGSSTSIHAQDLAQRIRPFAKLAEPIESYLIHDDTTVKYLFKFLLEKQIDFRQVAILTEGNTAFGRELRRAVEEKTKGPKNISRPLFLTYPLHISQLRAAAEKEKAATKNGSVEMPRTKPGNLRLSLEDAIKPKDVITNLSPFETFSTELVLANLLAGISREGIRYVGLFPTDVRDQIFLAREIRKRAPNIVLFTFGADLLSLHSDINLDFQGMLMFSTYPLFSMNQAWTSPSLNLRSRLQFPSDSTQGVYNAMLDLLNKKDLQLEHKFPFKTDSPGHALWLSAVGTNDLWPIQILNHDKPEFDKEYVSVVSDAAATYSKPLVFVLVSLALLSLFVSVALIMELSGKDRSIPFLRKHIRPKLAWYLKVCGDATFSDPGAHRRAFILSLAASNSIVSLVIFNVFTRFFSFSTEFSSIWTLFLFLACIAAMTAIVAMLWVGRKVFPVNCQDLVALHHSHPAILYGFLIVISVLIGGAWIGFPSVLSEHIAALGVIALFLVVLLLFLASRLAADNVPVSVQLRAALSSFAVAVVPIVVLCVAALQAFDISQMNPTTKLFYHLRTVNPASGLSPLVPLFFVAAGAVLWAVCSLRRLRMLEELIKPKANNPQLLYLGPDSTKALDAFEKRTKALLTHEFFQLPGSPLMLFFVGLPCFVLFLVRLVRSIEEPNFYLFFGLSFFAVYLALSFTFLRFLGVWMETHRLLNYLSDDSLTTTYAELAKTGDDMPKLDLSYAFAPYRALKFAAEQASLCVTSGKRIEIRKILEESAIAEARGCCRHAIKLRHEALKTLSSVAAELGGALQSPYRYNKEWIQNARRFFAAQTVVFLHHVISHLQNLLLFVVVGLILMLLAITYYPFQPREWLLWFNWVVIIATVSLTVAVFVQMGRNRVLSILSNTTPGQVTWNREFLFRVLLYVIVPVLTLLGAQFPESMRSILSWLGAFQNS